MKTRLSLVSVILAAIWPLQATCEPDASVKLLMNQPISLFDWGMRRLAESVEKRMQASDGAEELRKRGIAVDSAFSYYNWDENRIYIQVSATQAPRTAEACQLVLNVTRDKLIGEKIPREMEARRFLYFAFQHESSYAEKSRFNVSDQLAKITVVRASLGPILERLSCFGSLAGTDANVEITK